MSLLICDTEADNLLPYASKVHCISYKFVGQPVRTLTPDDHSEWKHILAQADEIVCHNIVGYDLVLWLKCGLIDSFSIGPDSINGRKVKILIHWCCLDTSIQIESVGMGLKRGASEPA